MFTSGAPVRLWSGKKERPRAYDTGYLSCFLTHLEGDGEVIHPLRSTVAVGGKHGRGRGKTRSRSGENTVAVGGNFTLETRTVATARSADFGYLCSQQESFMMQIFTLTCKAGSSMLREESVKEKRCSGMPDGRTAFQAHGPMGLPLPDSVKKTLTPGRCACRSPRPFSPPTARLLWPSSLHQARTHTTAAHKISEEPGATA